MIKEFKFGGQTTYNATAQQLLDMGFLQSDIDAALKAQDIADVDFNRRLAYRTDSDPLYMEWQYDQTETKEKEWRAKIAEIKARFPLPEHK
ncbi:MULTISPECIES: hypothetical protein [Pseudomonas]|jgi:hypothetical protein|uniref:hypothetical protein n=1 Tax=Pseudomonas TaxID=286 RepID=UPI000FE38467|nr:MULTISPECIES: hypothetical protein [Pseudomonas]MDF3240394.1 hypothetical protein [Pseudomonas veronii]RWA28740.1 hypothetical protein DJ028_03270 [Pseudomonas veronii]DAH52562.1 MAG TPA: UBA-like domain protein [Caudoviricetes sp.]